MLNKFHEDYKNLYNAVLGDMETVGRVLQRAEIPYSKFQAFGERLKTRTKCWYEGKSPKEVLELLASPGHKSWMYHVYADYQEQFDILQSQVYSKYDEWCRKNTHPDAVLTELQEEHPREGGMLNKFQEDYKNLYNAVLGDMETVGRVLQRVKIPYSDFQAFAEQLEKRTKWWYEGKSPKEVLELLERPGNKSWRHPIYTDYQEQFEILQSQVYSKYDEWCRKNTHPDAVLMQLQEEHPREGGMMNKYRKDYENLYNAVSGDMEIVGRVLQRVKIPYSDFQELAERLKERMEWWHERRDPKEVYKLLKRPGNKSWRHQIYADYQEQFYKLES